MSSKDTRQVMERDAVEPEKKRRRAIKTDSRIKSPSPDKRSKNHDVKQQHLTTRAVFDLEEAEVSRRTPQADLIFHGLTTAELRKTMNEIKMLKESARDGQIDESFEENKIHGTLQFVALKKLNRLGHIRYKQSRDHTNDAKQKIDQQHLQLQNLLYEANHLQKEITKCLQFKSKDEDINLVSIDDFYKDAPADMTRPEVTKKDEHTLKLARLEWELEQRKNLSLKRKEAKGYREGVLNDIKQKQQYLDSLQPKLNAILQSTKPVQEYLSMPFDEIREQHRTAKFLPQPLYVLYMQASAFKDACDKGLSVSILGDVDVAKTLQETQEDTDEDSDSDQEEQEKRSKKRRRRSTTNLMELKKQKVLRKHPLSILLSVTCKDGSVLHLTFMYLVTLGIMTVTVKLNQAQESVHTSISGGDLLMPDSMLTCLYPDDHGSDTPNQANKYVMKSLGLEEFSTYIEDVGRPYFWAQCLGGLQFLDAKGTPQADTQVSASYMEQTITQLRQRLASRQTLHEQLSAFESGNIVIDKDSLHYFPSKITSRLVQWKRSTFEDFAHLPHAAEVVSSGLATEYDLYFTGIAEKGSAKLQFDVVIGADYPRVNPYFVLDVSWRSTRKNRLNDKHIKDMEAEINVYCEELVTPKKRDLLLTHQIQRLLVCLDVYLETAQDYLGPDRNTEFTIEKVFPRLTRGPDRGKPYVFHGAMGFFAQR